MRGLHAVKTALRYAGIPLKETIVGEEFGYLIDRWSENNYPLGLWLDKQLNPFIARIQDDEEYMPGNTKNFWYSETERENSYEKQMLTIRDRTLNPDPGNMGWYLWAKSAIPEEGRRTTDNVVALPGEVNIAEIITSIREQLNADRNLINEADCYDHDYDGDGFCRHCGNDIEDDN